MIYLKPQGGLCNRMRSIESVVSLCQKFNKDLTILWVMDHALNCSFFQLFKEFYVKGINITVLDCPAGYPQNYIRSSVGIGAEILKKKDSTYFRRFKNLIKGRGILTTAQKKVVKNISEFDSKQILLNTQLEKMFLSQDSIGDKNSRQMDDYFVKRVEKKLLSLFLNKHDIYISSCYRLSPLNGNYELFKITDQLNTQVKTIIKDFNRTYGLHIRATDHIISKEKSSKSKFQELIRRILAVEPNANFYLATDEEEIKQAFINEFGSKIIYIKVKSYDRNSNKAIEDAIVDLYCLSKTAEVFGSHQSSFSQTASDIGSIKETTVL